METNATCVQQASTLGFTNDAESDSIFQHSSIQKNKKMLKETQLLTGVVLTKSICTRAYKASTSEGESLVVVVGVSASVKEGTHHL